MKVRAKQDGHYGGYYRIGPHEEADGSMAAGEVFEIDATPREVKDDRGRPIQEMAQTGELNSNGQPILKPVWVLDGKGNPKRDAKGNLIPKIKMATAFSQEWMEPVNEDASVDYPEQSKPLGVIAQMLPGKKANPNNVAARPVNLPSDIAAVLAGTAGNVEKSESPI